MRPQTYPLSHVGVGLADIYPASDREEKRVPNEGRLGYQPAARLVTAPSADDQVLYQMRLSVYGAKYSSVAI
jgi:hypothetical protein